MKNKPTLRQRAIAAGFCHPKGSKYHGMSAAELRAANPKLADRAANFLRENKAELIAMVVGRVMKTN